MVVQYNSLGWKEPEHLIATSKKYILKLTMVKGMRALYSLFCAAHASVLWLRRPTAMFPCDSEFL